MKQKKEPLLFTRGGSGAPTLPMLKQRLKAQLAQEDAHSRTQFLCMDLDKNQNSEQNAERQSQIK